MGVPKKRHTSSRRNTRRSHHALTASALVSCSHCRRFIAPHRMCPHCGYYGNRQVIDVLAKLSRRERKQHEREEKQRQAETKLAKQGMEKP
ncbi:MAG: hypothetical protein A2682_00220 [Candidatus Terrybacteria bacterium RIFCSPHIGHO2_01_FULL_58_15]|uniref:Large ribosomal subunit protein bL32 n=1 Tax=Terrybacteria sp. (strain RIFCSPHIGHO2_01_FULL_58_15) TaxID=1802363 RepID=A0A1G2PIU3_TERXR|nr:MAG: hypothetical protein A2682_00220 [Candidatus Terrybacteria bacterium RIFCSPHIGHO2_01_FULL_58_15]